MNAGDRSHTFETPVPPRSPLVGRETELATLSRWFADGDRCVTIVGPGGVGKTSLALEVMRQAPVRLCAFVDVAPVRDPEDIAASIANALTSVAGSSPLDSIVDRIGVRELLLLVDNFEQVLSVANIFTTLLDMCPRLRVLVTSRAPLRVSGERVFRLEAFAVPSPGLSFGELIEYPAMQLLVQRTETVRPEFRLTSENGESMAGLVRRVDGLPLALELCAARLATFTPEVMLARLDGNSSLDLLSRGQRDRPPRHGTMRHSIGWSYDLITDVDRAVLRRVSVFAGSASLDAIEHVCSSPDVPNDAVIDGVSDLADFNLLVVDDNGRFRLHAAVREFAAEQLGRKEELAAHKRLAEYIVALTTQRVDVADEVAWFARVDDDYPNVRAVIRRLDPQRRLQVAVALGPYWLRHGRLGEGKAFLATGLQECDHRDEAAVLWDVRLGVDLADPSQPHEMRRRVENVLASARLRHDRDLELLALDVLSHVLTFDEHSDQGAAPVVDTAIALARELGAAHLLAELLQRAAFLAERRGDELHAVALAAEGFDIARAIGARQFELYNVVTLLQLGEIATRAGVVLPPLDDVVELARLVGDQRWIANVGAIAGTHSVFSGSVATAARYYADGLDAAHRIRYRQGAGFCTMGAVAVAVMRGDADVAAHLHASLAPHLPFLRRGLPGSYGDTYLELVSGLVRVPGAAWDDMVEDAVRYLTAVASELPERGSANRQRHSLSLTGRELEVLDCMATGATNKEIAGALGLTAKTVMHHSTSIYRKLGVRGRAEATAVAFRTGLIGGDAAGPLRADVVAQTEQE